MALGGMATGGERRSVDSELNMVPMIDLLMCCISFLMLTAVWTTWGRLSADAQVPGPPGPCAACREVTKLHVTAQDAGAFTLAWKQGDAVLRTVEVARASEGGRYPALAQAITREWATRPAEASTHRYVSAVLHVDHRMHFGEMAALMDAVQTPKIEEGSHLKSPAFGVVLASN